MDEHSSIFFDATEAVKLQEQYKSLYNNCFSKSMIPIFEQIRVTIMKNENFIIHRSKTINPLTEKQINFLKSKN